MFRDYENVIEANYFYRKILRVNLSDNTYEIVKPGMEEWAVAGESETFSDWLSQFTENGAIHPEDMERFLNFTHLEHLKGALRSERKSLTCSYRRNSPEGYRWNMMEVISDAEYTDSKRLVLICIKDIHDMVKESLELDESSVQLQEILTRRDMQMAAILKSRFSVMTTVDLDNDYRCERIWLAGKTTEAQSGGVGYYPDYYRQAMDTFVCPEDVPLYDSVMNPEHMKVQAAQTEDYSEELFQYRSRKPIVQWLETYVIYIRKNGQIIVNILGRDITKEKIEEEKLLKKEQEQRGIINSLSSMFFATYYGDLEQNIFRSVNQLEDVEKILGNQLEYTAALNAYAKHFVHPDDRAEYLHTMSIRNLRQVLSHDHPFVTFAYRKLPKEGSEADYGWIRATAVMAQADENGKVKGIVYAAQDVTESKLKEMREQKALQAACEAANHANASKSEFLSRMSHDIRTPMNGIIGMTKIAADNVTDPERVKSCLEKITLSGNYLLSMINEILDMSEIEAGHVGLTADEFCLPELIDSVAETILPGAKAKGQEVKIHPIQVTSENQKVIGDRGRLQQVFHNILENAVKFTPDGGLLEVSVIERETKKYGCCAFDFIFRDNGIGMEEDFIPRIFEPFSRAEDSRTSKVVGAGLGMTITQNIVRMMGGHIVVKSSPGQGTEVTVTLPLRLQNVDIGEQGENAASEVQELAANMPFTGFRVLLVEDNEINQEIAMEIIGATGAEVECAEDGKIALERFEEMPEGYYDLIFMDIQMPVMNGYESTRAIRMLPRDDASSIPIIALSANSHPEDIAAGREAGMNEHMAKPLDVHQLLTEMSRWLK